MWVRVPLDEPAPVWCRVEGGVRLRGRPVDPDRPDLVSRPRQLEVRASDRDRPDGVANRDE